MTHGPHSGGEQTGMLRRVAIVLSSLPPSVASELLGSMSNNARQSVHRAMSGLSDIDPLERRRAYHAFKTSMEQQPPQQSEVTASSNAATSQLLFLEEVGDQDLLELLVGEHPQTIAVVLASITPEKAGAILPRLDARTQTETLRRIGRLDTFPGEAIADVAELFQQRVSEKIDRGPRMPGQSALNAILSAMPGHSHPNMNPVAAEHSNASDHHTDHRTTRTDSRDFVDRHEQTDFPTTGKPQRDLEQKLRVAEHTLPDSTDAIAKHLESLTTAELCQALGRVDTRVAMLALCGLPNQVSESALAMLPKAAAKKVRSAMSSLHSLNLRDIDDAKEAIARVSVAGASVAGASVAGASVAGNPVKSNQHAPVAA